MPGNRVARPLSIIGACRRNLMRRPLRSALTAAGIAVAVASFIALTGTSRGADRAWTRSLLERGAHLVAVRRGAIEMLAASIDASTAAAVRAVPGVRAAAGELVDYVEIGDDGQAIARGWESDSFLWDTLPLAAGARPRDRDDVVLGATLAEDLGARLGETVLVYGRKLRVSGIAAQSDVMGQGVLIADLATLQELMERPGKVTLFNLRVDQNNNRASIEFLRGELNRRFPHLRFEITSEAAQNDRILKFLRALTWAISTIALLVGILVAFNTLLMAVSERSYDIGVLAAIGWSQMRILALVLLEGLLLAAIGSAFGATLGISGLQLIARQPMLRGLIEPAVTWGFLVEVLAAALIIGLAGSLYPAWRASRTEPALAMRRE
jgi:putative ABC transport system permease protein